MDKRANLAATEDLAGSDLTNVMRLREESFSAPQRANIAAGQRLDASSYA